jgi:hypothetical protein
MASKAAKEWARKVYARAPVVVHFTRVPAECRRTRCSGYHETYAVYVNVDGAVWLARQYNHHAFPLSMHPLEVGYDEEALAQLAFRLLRWAREVEPWARYPEMGYRPGDWTGVWF